MTSSNDRHSITLPAEPSSAARARRFVRDHLHPHLDCSDGLLVAVSELVTNVVVHASTDVEVSVTVAEAIRIEVADGAAASQAFRELVASPPAPAPPEATHGRGMGFVHALADRVGLADRDGGKVVWFEVDVAVGDEGLDHDRVHPRTEGAGVAHQR